MVTRGKSKFADYVLYYKPNIPIAIIEAKAAYRNASDGLQQAKEYAQTLGVRFAVGALEVRRIALFVR